MPRANRLLEIKAWIGHTPGPHILGWRAVCLVADVEIRKQTGNRKGLQDALRAIVAAGGPSITTGR